MAVTAANAVVKGVRSGKYAVSGAVKGGRLAVTAANAAVKGVRSGEYAVSEAVTTARGAETTVGPPPTRGDAW